MLYTWELSEGGWCWGARSLKRIYGWKDVPTFQEQTSWEKTSRWRQREETEGLVYSFIKRWLRTRLELIKNSMLSSIPPSYPPSSQEKTKEKRIEWVETAWNYICVKKFEKPCFVTHYLKVDFARRKVLTWLYSILFSSIFVLIEYGLSYGLFCCWHEVLELWYVKMWTGWYLSEMFFKSCVFGQKFACAVS